MLKLDFITVEEAMAVGPNRYIDVRSPKEFMETYIPGAINLPLLNNEERELIGTIYKQDCPEKAEKNGIEIVMPKIPELMSSLLTNTGNSNIILYCWRGGLRSQSMAKICYEYNFPVKILKGGYKAYRRYVVNFFDKPFQPRVAVLHGLTGTGKTLMLKNLMKFGIKSIDLEGLAKNKGSVFGQINGGHQPSQKIFEAHFLDLCHELTNQDFVITECEGKRIGNIHVPGNFYEAMNHGYRIHLYANLQARVERILTEYSLTDIPFIKAKISLLTKYLGKHKIEQLNQKLEKNNFEEVVRILLLDYYDPLYGYADSYDRSFDLSVDCTDLEAATLKVSSFFTEQLLGRYRSESRGASKSSEKRKTSNLS